MIALLCHEFTKESAVVWTVEERATSHEHAMTTIGNSETDTTIESPGTVSMLVYRTKRCGTVGERLEEFLNVRGARNDAEGDRLVRGRARDAELAA